MSSLQLKIHRINRTCIFELTWGKGRQISATLNYPEVLTTAYQEWQQIYLSYYKSPLRGRVDASGYIAYPAPIDWHAKLVRAETKLLFEFHHWLRSAELYEIRATIAKNQENKSISIFISCLSIELERLPWETWEIGTEFWGDRAIKIVRTPVNIRQTSARIRQGKARILAILGDERGLNFQADRKAVRSLSKLAEVHFIGWQPGEKIDELRTKICQTIADERGWDILFFAGHSNETAMTGGELAIAPNTTLSISELIPALVKAKERGLQFALFNSCSGLSIANSLINLGLPQVAVMREPIHNAVAQVLVVRFLQGLAQQKNVCEALVAACQSLKLDHQLTFPSAYLIPSLFCHPDAELFQIKAYGIEAWIERCLPTRTEAIALLALILLSLNLSVQDFLLEKRLLAQAVYRQVTAQIPPDSTPPVLLVQIDEKSIRKAKMADPKPMDRTYLAQLVDRLTAFDAKIIGIDYLLDRPHGKSDRALAKSLQAAIQKQPHPPTFVLAAVRDATEGWLTPLAEIANPHWSLHGHINFVHWYVELVPPQISKADKLPFAYLLALSHQLQADSSQIYPQLSSQTDYLSQILPLRHPSLPQFHPLTYLSYQWGQIWLQPIIDFSIPPTQVYQYLPAWQLLENPVQLQNLSQQIVIIAPGGYAEAGVFQDSQDNFALPAAIAYWFDRNHLNRDRLTGAEAHAYMIHHFLNQRLVVPIPDVWAIAVAVIFAKIAILSLGDRQQYGWLILLSGTTIFGIISLQLYLDAAILLPWFLPSATLSIYALEAKVKRLKS